MKRELSFKQAGAASVTPTASSTAPPDSDSESLFPESDDNYDGTIFLESDSEGLLVETDEECFPASDEEFFPASDDENNDATETARRRPKHSMVFSGKFVCQFAFQALLGVGTSTVSRLRHNGPAFTRQRQEPRPKHPFFNLCMQGNRKWFSVVMFLWIVWNSCAETLPTELKMPRREAPGIQDEDYSLRVVNGFLNNLAKHDYDPENFHQGPGTFNGPRRFLQHSSRTNLYWKYRAYCQVQNMDPCQYGMFMKVANKLLKPGVRNSHLAFRKVGQFGKCDICFDLKRRIRASKAEERTKLYKKYSTHILEQWLDRQRYWAHRTLSRAFFDQARQLGLRHLRDPSGLNKALLATCSVFGVHAQTNFPEPEDYFVGHFKAASCVGYMMVWTRLISKYPECWTNIRNSSKSSSDLLFTYWGDGSTGLCSTSCVAIPT